MLNVVVPTPTAGCTRPDRAEGLPRWWILAALMAASVWAGACFGGDEPFDEPPGPSAERDPCGGRCDVTELCVEGAPGIHECARLCANQLRCWSGCCLPLGDTGYNVCRPRDLCFSAR